MFHLTPKSYCSSNDGCPSSLSPQLFCPAATPSDWAPPSASYRSLHQGAVCSGTKAQPRLTSHGNWSEPSATRSRSWCERSPTWFTTWAGPRSTRCPDPRRSWTLTRLSPTRRQSPPVRMWPAGPRVPWAKTWIWRTRWR